MAEVLNTNSHQTASDVDDQIQKDRLAAIEAERQEILSVFYEAEMRDFAPAMQPLLTDSEILALFDSGYDVDMICLAYPEFALNKIKQLKRRWSDKNHRKKRKSQPCTEEKSEETSNEKDKDNKTPSSAVKKKKKKKRRRRSKSKQ